MCCWSRSALPLERVSHRSHVPSRVPDPCAVNVRELSLSPMSGDFAESPCFHLCTYGSLKWSSGPIQCVEVSCDDVSLHPPKGVVIWKALNQGRPQVQLVSRAKIYSQHPQFVTTSSEGSSYCVSRRSFPLGADSPATVSWYKYGHPSRVSSQGDVLGRGGDNLQPRRSLLDVSWLVQLPVGFLKGHRAFFQQEADRLQLSHALWRPQCFQGGHVPGGALVRHMPESWRCLQNCKLPPKGKTPSFS